MWLLVDNNELGSIRKQEIPHTFVVPYCCHRTQIGVAWVGLLTYDGLECFSRLFGRKVHEVSSENIFSMLNEGMVFTLCMLSNANSTTSFNESCFKVNSKFCPM